MFAAVILLVIVIAYRVVVALALSGDKYSAALHNFSPLAALVLCGALFLPRRIALLLPFSALFISDLILNAHYGVALLNIAMLPQYLAFAGVAALGWSLRGKPQVWRVLGASVLGSLFFYVVTNTGAWMAEPRYAGNFAGWIQALTVGLPEHQPTWMFFRNTLLSDLIFTSLFLVCVGGVTLPSTKRGLAPVASA